jgi:hypothetical protein
MSVEGPRHLVGWHRKPDTASFVHAPPEQITSKSAGRSAREQSQCPMQLERLAGTPRVRLVAGAGTG